MRLPLKEYQRNKKTTSKRVLKWFFLGIVVPPGIKPLKPFEAKTLLFSSISYFLKSNHFFDIVKK